MKRLPALALSFLVGVSPAFSQVRVGVRPVAAPGLKTAGAVSLPAPALTPALTPALAAPSLVPVLAAPAAVAAKAATPAPTAVSARETLAAVAQAPAPRSAEQGWSSGRAAFDAGTTPRPEVPVLSAPAGLSRPSLAANAASGRSAPEVPRAGLRLRALEAAETAVHGGGAALLSGLLVLWLGGTPWLAPAMAAASHAASRVMFESLGSLRSTVVDGWQASHDQRYRVGGDGRLRDVRGHKYGEDRYERRAPGPVGRTAATLIVASAFAAGALWLWGASPAAFALYAALYAALEAVAARGRARAAPPPEPMSAEGRAHAARFRE